VRRCYVLPVVDRALRAAGRRVPLGGANDAGLLAAEAGDWPLLRALLPPWLWLVLLAARSRRSPASCR
jgi:hypothetical protein